MQKLRRLVGAVSAAVVVGLTLALAALSALPAVDARAMAVTSGSMEPAIPVGSLLVVRQVDPESVSEGDVITFAGYTASALTTHRVLDRVDVQDKLHFKTQGDANDTADVDLAPAAGVVGRAVLHVPEAGRALGVLSSPLLRTMVLGVPAAWMALAQARRLGLLLRMRARHAAPTPSLQPTSASLCLFLVIAATGSALALGMTRAVMSDTEDVSHNTFATGSWPAG